jgi:ribosomal protein S18 acetylase RimI-like enzyme
VRQAYVMKCERAPAVPEEPIAGLEIEIAKAEDAKAILELYLACGFEPRSEERMREVLADGRHAHAVARAGSDLAAFVEFETHWPRRPWVAFAGVAKERRDRGLGSGLVAWLLARQFASGAKAGLLALSPANRTALRAYEKVGFKRFRLIDALEKKL